MIAVELRKLFRRPRTWITIALLNSLPVLVAVLLEVTDLAPRPGEGPAFLSAVLTNGTLFPLAALAIVLPLFLPIAVAVVAGDSVAGEAQGGTLRYLLARPAGRTRLLVAKLVAVVAFVLVTVVIVAVVGYLVGTALFEVQSLGATTAVSGTSLTPEQVAGRTLLSIGYVTVSMLGVAAFALFFSTLTDSPQLATLGALAVLIGSSLLFTLDAASDIAPYLPTRYWLSFVDFFRDPILWRNVGPRAGSAGGLRGGAAGCGVGELHHQGHHQLAAPAGYRGSSPPDRRRRVAGAGSGGGLLARADQPGRTGRGRRRADRPGVPAVGAAAAAGGHPDADPGRAGRGHLARPGRPRRAHRGRRPPGRGRPTWPPCSAGWRGTRTARCSGSASGSPGRTRGRCCAAPRRRRPR